MSQAIKITATGIYPREIPQPLTEALKEEIARHMAAYGVTEARVAVETEELEPGKGWSAE